MNQKEAFNKVFDQFTEEEKTIAESNRFAYVFSKAWKFTQIGPEQYRLKDFFHQPPQDFDEQDLEIIAYGCKQVLEGIGMSKEKPFTGLDVAYFRALFEMFHFKKIDRQSQYGFLHNNIKGALDCITFQHVIDGSQVVYYNFCEYPSIKE